MASVFHISEEEAARDFKALVARVRAGEEVVVEHAGRPVVVMKAAETGAQIPGRRSIAEARTLLREAHGAATLAEGDPDHAIQMEVVHAIYNEPMDTSKWD